MIASALLALLLSPILALLLLVYGVALSPRVGMNGRQFNEVEFEIKDRGPGKLLRALHLHRYAVLWNILCGDMSFIGPRAASPEDVSLRDSGTRYRLRVRPGLVCLWWVRKRVNIAFDPESNIDAEYVETQSVAGDLGIALRSVFSAMYGRQGDSVVSGRISVLGIKIDNLAMGEAVSEIMRRTDCLTPSKVSFVNANCANMAWRNQEYMRTLLGSDLTLPDGIGMKLAGRMLKQDIRENVNGTDLFPRLCEAMEAEGKSIFLYGGRPGVAERVCEWIAARYPKLKICGAQHGYMDKAEELQALERINDAKPDVLIVALGSPRQEIWIRDHIEQTGARVALGVGGLLDFYSGRIPRAPLWMREMGFEWVFRFIQEPTRLWKRYLIGNTMFMFRFLCHRTKGRTYRVKGRETKCVL